jgi:hypothetical protein
MRSDISYEYDPDGAPDIHVNPEDDYPDDEEWSALPVGRPVITVELPEPGAAVLTVVTDATVTLCDRTWRLLEGRASDSYRQHRCGLPADGHRPGSCRCRYCGAAWKFGG